MFGLVLVLTGLLVLFFSFHTGILISIIGIIILIIKKQRDFSSNIKKERAKKIYFEIRYSFPISEQTFHLSKIFDLSPNIDSHRIWLKNAVDALEKEYRISKKKMFHYNRNHTSAKHPYISITPVNMNYKTGENYERVFFKSGNYLDICKYMKRRPILSLKEELDIFSKLIEKQENK